MPGPSPRSSSACQPMQSGAAPVPVRDHEIEPDPKTFPGRPDRAAQFRGPRRAGMGHAAVAVRLSRIAVAGGQPRGDPLLPEHLQALLPPAEAAQAVREQRVRIAARQEAGHVRHVVQTGRCLPGCTKVGGKLEIIPISDHCHQGSTCPRLGVVGFGSLAAVPQSCAGTSGSLPPCTLDTARRKSNPGTSSCYCRRREQ